MATLAVGLIIETIDFASEVEKIKGYWDDKGLDFHIAVKQDGRLAVSTKHWSRVHYIVTDKSPEEIWDAIKKVAAKISRNLVRSKLGPYVFIPKLNIEQSQHVFDFFKQELGYNILRKWEFSWDIDDAILPASCLEKIH